MRGGSQAVSGHRGAHSAGGRQQEEPGRRRQAASRLLSGPRQGGRPAPQSCASAHRRAHGNAVGQGPSDVHDRKVAAQALLQAQGRAAQGGQARPSTAGCCGLCALQRGRHECGAAQHRAAANGAVCLKTRVQLETRHLTSMPMFLVEYQWR